MAISAPGRMGWAVFASLLVIGCKSTIPTPDSGTPVTNQGTEWVSYHSEVPISVADLDALMSGMFGPKAQAGEFLTQKEVAKAFFVTSQKETATPDQVRLSFAFDDGSTTPRLLAATPASFTLGKLFVSTVDAAIAKMQ